MTEWDFSPEELHEVLLGLEAPNDDGEEEEDGDDDLVLPSVGLLNRVHLYEYLLGLEWNVEPRPGHPSTWPRPTLRDYRVIRAHHRKIKRFYEAIEAAAQQADRMQARLHKQWEEGRL